MMRLVIMIVPLIVANVVMASAGASARAVEAGNRSSVNELASRARQAFEQGEFEQAIRLYEELRPQLPDAAELPYNAGIAAYRAGDMESASRYFREALAQGRSPAIQSRAAENLGHVIAKRIGGDDSEAAADPAFSEKLDLAIRDMRDVFRHFRSRVHENPTDDAARANAERAQRQLQRLQELREQLQDQQQQESSSEEPQQQQSQQPSESNQPSQNQQQQEQQQQSQSQQQQQQQRGEQQAQQQQSAENSSHDGSEQQQSQGADEPTEEPQPQQRAHEREMSDDEAERLLQRVRDRNRQREQQRAAHEARSGGRVEKDW